MLELQEEKEIETQDSKDLGNKIPSYSALPNSTDKPLNKLSQLQRAQRYYSTAKLQYVDKCLAPNFMATYWDHLTSEWDVIKENNAIIRKTDKDEALKEIMDLVNLGESASPDYVSSVRNQIYKGIEKVVEFGISPRTYKPMGISPRICPQMYGKSMNSVKKVARKYFYLNNKQKINTTVFKTEVVSANNTRLQYKLGQLPFLPKSFTLIKTFFLFGRNV